MDNQIHSNRHRSSLFNDSWIWKMAWIDGRNNISRLGLLFSSIVIGIAGLVAINSFHDNLQADIERQSKDLLGADLVAEANRPFEQEILNIFDSTALPQSEEASFASMVSFKATGETRLIRVVALRGKYPYYGIVTTRPEGRFEALTTGNHILVDESLASQYNISTDDTLRIGNADFIVKGEMVRFPGGTVVSTTFTPSIYVSLDNIGSTGLIQFGSRVNYKRYFKTESNENTESLIERLEPVLRKYGHGYDTVEERKEDLGEGLANLYKFFNLLAFIALILGCLGIASSVLIYAKEKRGSVAVLRCLGASGWQAFNIFFAQTMTVGVLGSLLGVFLGVFIQFVLPTFLNNLIPIEIELSLSWSSIIEGVSLGIITSVIFAMLPLLSVRYVPPLYVLRIDTANKVHRSTAVVGLGIIAALFPLLFAWWLTGSFLSGASFFGGLATAFVILYLLSLSLISMAKRFFPAGASFIFKQSLSNLFRPNNQTTVLVLVIGLGAFLVSTLLIVQTSLLNQVEFTGNGSQSNTILFDIQADQKEDLVRLTKENQLPVNQLVPIITCRLQEVNGRSIEEIQNDTTDAIPNWALTREYRVTYRDTLTTAEELTSGKIQYISKGLNTDSIFVTISNGMQENLQLQLGDSLIFDVQGFPIKVYLGGIREVEWPQDPPNFIFVFPSGVLEEAPQIYVLTTRVEDQKSADKYSREVVAKFPNISLIDLRLIIRTISEFFDKISFVIQFMALFSIITGLVVLAGAVVNSRYARLKENVLLRTLGAVKGQIVGMTVMEYIYLGAFAGLSGIVLSILAGWGLSIFLFKVIFVPNLPGLLVVLISVISLTVIVGWINTRKILRNSPLEVLRKEI